VAGVVVVGGGPAGAVFAARMAQLGHDVSLIERVLFPRSRLGESLTPGVLPLLDMIGARVVIERAGFRPVRSVSTRWDGDRAERRETPRGGLIVDRGRFDTLVLERARALGVRVLQPAATRGLRRQRKGWTLRVEAHGHALELQADFLADASGRSAALPARRSMEPVRTVALYAYWRGPSLPDEPRIEAGHHGWYWGVPLPDGRYNTLVFTDPQYLRECRNAIAEVFHRFIADSGIMAGCPAAALDGPVRAVDATPYVDREGVTSSSIKVGDAALAIDPMSSSGVQKAIQTALAGAVVANTLLRRPESAGAAMQFYRMTLEHASARHRRWAAERYASVATRRAGAFWQDRAAGAIPDSSRAFVSRDAPPSPGHRVELSPLLEFVDVPCIEHEFVTMKVAVRHPDLDAPLAYLGNWELAPLLKNVRPGMTSLEMARSWSDRVPLESSLAIAAWLLDRSLLVSVGNGEPSAVSAATSR
jgi:flavin-dependent dehydrogenase